MRRFMDTGCVGVVALSLVWLAAGCDGEGDPDAGTLDDGGTPMTDALVPDVDAFVPDVDAFVPDVDGGPDVDAGPIGGGAATSTQIQAARDATGAVALPIDGAIVTYVKPALGDDDPGFFIQAERVGPAIFIAVDPSTLTPAPAVGSVVSFTVMQVGPNQGMRQVTAISDYAEESSGHDVGFLVQDLSEAADIVSGLDDYESELIRVTGELFAPFRNAGAEHVSIELITPALTADPDLPLVRMPIGLPEELSLTGGCDVRFQGPMWRNEAIAQPSVYAASDVQVITCPSPQLLEAFATSPTEVVARFSRAIDMDSLTTPATQFTITGGAGLTVSAATVDGTEVTLTTDTQVGGQEYTLTVASSVIDVDGVSVDPAFDTDMFNGFVDRAELVINEINPLVANNCDLIELRVTRGGNLDGYVVQADLTTIFTFGAPSLAMVETNDIIVLHLNRAQARCRDASWTTGATPPAAVDETAAVDENTTLPANYDTAFDVWSANGGLNMNASVITVSDTSGAILDAAAYYATTATGVSFGTLERIEEVRMASEWTDPGSVYDETSYETHAITATFVVGGPAVDSPSVQRTSNADTNAAADWALEIGPAAHSWGTINDGQSAL